MTYVPLAGGDPFPGDPDVLGELVLRLNQYAQAFSDYALKVGGSVSESWVGNAADMFRDRQSEIPPKLQMAASRMSRIAGTISPFLNQLHTIQDQAKGVASAARSVADQLANISSGVHQQQAFNHQQMTLQLAGKPPQPWTGPRYIEQQHQLRQKMQGLQYRFDSLTEEYSALVAMCIGGLEQAKQDGLQNNALTVFGYEGQQIGGAVIHGAEAVWNAVDAALPEISHLLDGLSKLLDIAQLLVVVLAIVVAVVAVVTLQPELLVAALAIYEYGSRALSAASLGVSSVKAAVDTRLAQTSRGTWSEVEKDAVSMGFSAVGLLSGSPSNTLKDLKGLKALTSVKTEITTVVTVFRQADHPIVLISQTVERIAEPNVIAGGKFLLDHWGQDYVEQKVIDKGIDILNSPNFLSNVIRSTMTQPFRLGFPTITVALPPGGFHILNAAPNG